MNKISQSLIKEVMKEGHCPRQIMYSFIEGKEMNEPTENMKIGRYFESELLGSCVGGQKQEAKLLKGGEKAAAYKDCDFLIDFAREVFEKLGLDVSKGQSQLSVKTEHLVGNLDHVNIDIGNPNRKAIYDIKWTATKIDDRWNGWGDPESMTDAHIQARHYVLTYLEKYGEALPFYFLVFGKDNWVKVIKVVIQDLEGHKQLIAHTSRIMSEYAEDGFKGNGNFNKCLSCPFYKECPDKETNPETITIKI